MSSDGPASTGIGGMKPASLWVPLQRLHHKSLLSRGAATGAMPLGLGKVEGLHDINLQGNQLSGETWNGSCREARWSRDNTAPRSPKKGGYLLCCHGRVCNMCCVGAFDTPHLFLVDFMPTACAKPDGGTCDVSESVTRLSVPSLTLTFSCQAARSSSSRLVQILLTVRCRLEEGFTGGEHSARAPV